MARNCLAAFAFDLSPELPLLLTRVLGHRTAKTCSCCVKFSAFFTYSSTGINIITMVYFNINIKGYLYLSLAGICLSEILRVFI